MGNNLGEDFTKHVEKFDGLRNICVRKFDEMAEK